MSDSSVQTFHEAQRPSFPLRYEPLTIWFCLNIQPNVYISQVQTIKIIKLTKEVYTLSYFSNSSLSAWLQFLPIGETFSIPLRNSKNVPLKKK